jgi:hypothetical protein
MGGGVAFLLAGVLFTFVFSVVGLVLIGIALAGWIGEIHHAR